MKILWCGIILAGLLPAGAGAAGSNLGSTTIPQEFGAATAAFSGQLLEDGNTCAKADYALIGSSVSCSASITVRHVYKGQVQNGQTLHISFILTSRTGAWKLTRAAFFLIFTCGDASAYQVCTERGNVYDMSPEVDPHPTNAGLRLLTSDAVVGLSTSDAEQRQANVNILLSMDLTGMANALVRAKEMATSATERLYMDTLLARASDYEDIKADLQEIDSLADAHVNPGAGVLLNVLIQSPSPVLVDLLPYLERSPRNDERLLALEILRQNPTVTSVTDLVRMLDDPEPYFSYYATKLLGARTNIHFPDTPSGAQFDDPIIRAAYINEWKQWAQSQGYAPVK